LGVALGEPRPRAQPSAHGAHDAGPRRWEFPLPWGYPNSWMIYKGNPIKMDDSGVPPLSEISI